MKKFLFISFCFFAMSTVSKAQIACNGLINISLDLNGEANLNYDMFTEGSSTVGYDTIWLNTYLLTCADVGNAVQVTVYAEKNGVIDSCTSNILVEDKFAPVPIVDFTIEVDVSNGPVTITPEMLDDGSYDDCGIASMELDINSFDCGSVNPTIVILTVTDFSNNSNQAVIEVIPVGGEIEVQGGVLHCSADHNISVFNGPVEYTVSDALLFGPSACADEYLLEITNNDSNGPAVSNNTFTTDHIGSVFTAKVTYLLDGSMCSKQITITDDEFNAEFCAYDPQGNPINDVTFYQLNSGQDACVLEVVPTPATVTPTKAEDSSSGVDYIDAFLLALHIYESIYFDNNQLFAADINGDGVVSELDLTILLDIIENNTNLPQSWFFYDAEKGIDGSETQATIDQTFDVIDQLVQYSAVGLKLGDVDMSNQFQPEDDDIASFAINDQVLYTGEIQQIEVAFDDASSIFALDLELIQENSDYRITNITSALPDFSFDISNDVVNGLAQVQWIASTADLVEGIQVNEGEVLFTIEIEALNNTTVSNITLFSSESRNKIVYNETTNVKYLEIEYENIITVPVKELEVLTFTIQPNPAQEVIYISHDFQFVNPEYVIYNISGKAVLNNKLTTNEINVRDLEKGMYFISIRDQGLEFNQKLIVVD
jgi:hypothetical protein